MTDTVLFLTTPATVGASGTTVSVSHLTPDRITVAALASGTIAVGQVVVACEANSFNQAINAGTTIVSQISGTPGGAGVYALSRSQTDVDIAYPLAYFLTPQTWTVPADFGPVNTIEVLAGGAQGGANRGEGGGGGTYTKVVNAGLTPGGTVGYVVGRGVSGVSIGGTQALQGYDTALGLTTSGSPTVAAKGGISGSPGNSAQDPAWSTGTTIHIGGHTVTSSLGLGGAGGGGAGGPNGAGGAGDNPGGAGPGGGGGGADGGANASGGNGGASFLGVAGGPAGNPGVGGGSGSGGGGGIANSAGGSGSMEPMWTSNPGAVAAGPGSGGGGGAYNGAFAGGAAGGYGGGGGGGGYSIGAGGAGTQGIIVITYTPVAPTASARHPIWID